MTYTRICPLNKMHVVTELICTPY